MRILQPIRSVQIHVLDQQWIEGVDISHQNLEALKIQTYFAQLLPMNMTHKRWGISTKNIYLSPFPTNLLALGIQPGCINHRLRLLNFSTDQTKDRNSSKTCTHYVQGYAIMSTTGTPHNIDNEK